MRRYSFHSNRVMTKETGLVKAVSRILLGIMVVVFAACNSADERVVNNAAEFTRAIENARPGDRIVLANGEWKDVELLVNAHGTADSIIEITAQEKGKVIITGKSNLRISGSYVLVSGLVFRDGYTLSTEVIAFREKQGVYANNCRLTECVIDNFNNPERSLTDTWVALYGKNNRVDHCYLVGKRGSGVTMTVRMVDELCHENHHRIDHNYFGYRQNFGANGGETLRLGTSFYSLKESGTMVEANYFEHCDGEHEIISNKSCGNVFRNNTFFECRGTLTYRHGNDNVAEGNFFFGNGKEYTGGIRIINERNQAINNYFYGLKGYRFRGALVIMNGVPNSPINRYFQVKGGVFSNNTFVDCDHIQLCAGSDSERSLPPVDSKIENNIFYHSSAKQIFTAYDDISGIRFQNNYLNEGLVPPDGMAMKTVPMKLVRNEHGLFIPVSDEMKQVGCSLAAPVATAENTGVSWYPRREEQLTFDTGKRVVVEPGLNTLYDAILNSQSGDVLVLNEGLFLNDKSLVVTHPLTLVAAHRQKAIVCSEKNDVFTIENEGALKLKGLKMTGEYSPDMAGNSIVSTAKHAMNRNYKLIVEDCLVENLKVNHSFDFLRVAQNTFADSVVFRNCIFRDITGSVASLNKETDDLGVYNAEYVIYENCRFENVDGSVLNLYRGGTDESTFGPKLIFSGCKVLNCGHEKRNKFGASIYLHGVQVAEVEDSEFIQSAPVRLFLTNGEPRIRLSGLNIYPKTDIVSNSDAYVINQLTHKKS